MSGTSTSTDQQASGAPPHTDTLSDLAFHARSLFSETESNPEMLQNLIDSLTTKVVGTTFEVFREEFDSLVRLLRSAYGQIGQFVKGDFRKGPGFYLGQLHALGEVAHRLGHQRVPKEALSLVARSDGALAVLQRVMEEKSVGAGQLARTLGMEESNLSSICKPLVRLGLLRRDRFGRRVRYSPTSLTLAVVSELGNKTSEECKTVKEGKGLITDRVNTALKRSNLALPAVTESLMPGTNVMANTSDFMGGLLTLAAVRGAKSIAIASSGSHVRMNAAEDTGAVHVRLPDSVSKPLSKQLEVCSTLPHDQESAGRKRVFDWYGEKLLFGNEQMGAALKVEFVGKLDPQKFRTKAKVAFQEIHANKERMLDFERIYVREILEGCKWEQAQAAEILGIRLKELTYLIKDLKISEKEIV